MKSITLFIFIYLLSCGNHQSNTTITKELSKEDSLKNILIGKWGALNEKPSWNIANDSIYYYDTSSHYQGWHPYKIVNNDVVIYFPDHTGTLMNVNIIKDTLFFHDTYEYDWIIKAFRSKQ